LPGNVYDLKAMMKEGIALELIRNLTVNYTELPDYKKQLVKYSGSALIHGRPLSGVMIVTAGETGKGYTISTISKYKLGYPMYYHKTKMYLD